MNAPSTNKVADVSNVAWIAVDWGTSSLRVWVMAKDGSILQAMSSEQGMKTLSSKDYEGVLLSLCEEWLPSNVSTPIIVCGMAGSREGWRQAAYLNTPLALSLHGKSIVVETEDERLSVFIIPGLMQEEPAEVMRGEETQVLGFLSHHPDFEGIVLLPGTHSKCVTIKNNRIEKFSTYMTGELFAILSEHSILSQSVETLEWSESDFELGVKQSLQNPVGLTNHLFSLRAESLLKQTQPKELKARLSGQLIGLELASITSNSLEALESTGVAIIGATKVAKLYQHALNLIGINSDVMPSEEMTLLGLNAARQSIAPTVEYISS